MKAPATLDEFYRTFPPVQRCWEALRRMRWPDGFSCPRCEGRRAHRLRSRGPWQCAACRYQASRTAGTPFHGTRVPLRTWFLAIFFVARHKQGISALQFQRDAGLASYKAAWTLLHKVRSTLAHNPLFRLEGDVEVDETYIGGYRPGWNGRGVGKTGVAFAVERREKTADSMRFIQIPNATRVVLNAFVENSIRPGKTSVFTDAWGSYKALAKLGIDHRPRKGGHGRQALNILPWAHSVFGNLKTWLRGLPRSQPKAPPALPRRVQLPLRPPLARGRALRLRPAPCGARPAPFLPATRGGGSGIGRVRPIRPGDLLCCHPLSI
jgi:ribosomal protein L37AE/L43A